VDGLPGCFFLISELVLYFLLGLSGPKSAIDATSL
jgi:hypothetical protein